MPRVVPRVMPRVARSLRLLVVLASLLASGAALGPAGAATPPAKHQPSCRTFFTGQQIVDALGGTADIGSLQKAPASSIYGSLIPHGTNCGYLWNESQTGNPYLSCTSDSLGLYSNYSPGYGWITSYGYTPQQFRHLKHTQKQSPVAPDPNASTDQTVGTVKLHHGIKAFSVHDPDYCGAGTYPDAYALYVLTKRHDLVAVFMWPATLGGEIGLVQAGLLSHPKF